MLKENYPIWCNGVSPVGCFNKQVDKLEFVEEIEKRKDHYQGAIAVCDDSGVVVIPKGFISEEFYNRLVAIEEQEDIWYDPEVYTITSLTGQALTDYYQRDLTPLWLPDGLTPSKQNGRAEQVIAADGAIVSDMAVLDFYSGFQDDNLPELYEDTNAAKGLSLSVSRLGILPHWDYVLPEQERQATDIDGIAVTLGVSIRPCEPAGTVEVINAEWESGGLHFQLTAQQIERADVVKTIASIITGTADITIIN